jgi:hypothetical protein
MDPISRFLLSVVEDMTVITVAFVVWYVLMHWLHDSIRKTVRRSDDTFLLTPFILLGALAGAGGSLYVYFLLKWRVTGGFFTPLLAQNLLG